MKLVVDRYINLIYTSPMFKQLTLNKKLNLILNSIDKVTDMNVLKKAFLSPQPVRTFKDLVTGDVKYNQLEVLMNLENNTSISQVSNSFEVDMFLVGLNNKSVFKIDSTFLYAIHEAEDFSFIMMPEADKEQISHLINFITAEGVAAVIEVPRISGKKYYTVESLQKNIKKVVDFSSYVKYVEPVTGYPVAIVNDLPFTGNVVCRGDYYLLEIPTKPLKLSQHISNYRKVYFKDIVPMLEDKHGYFEYSDSDFKFILRLVLQYHFNPKRIAEVFKLPSEAFIGHLVSQYRYKLGNVEAMLYTDINHDV